MSILGIDAKRKVKKDIEKITSIIVDLNEKTGSYDISFNLNGKRREFFVSSEFSKNLNTRNCLSKIEDSLQELLRSPEISKILWEK